MAKPMLRIDIDMPDLGYMAKQVGMISLDKPFKATCDEVIADAWKRVRARQRITGGRYRNLNEETVITKIKTEGMSRGEAETPLFRSGRMMQSLDKSRLAKNRWRIWFKGARNARIAAYHILQGASRARILRPFFLPYLTTRERKHHISRVRQYLSKEFGIIMRRTDKKRKKIKGG